MLFVIRMQKKARAPCTTLNHTNYLAFVHSVSCAAVEWLFVVSVAAVTAQPLASVPPDLQSTRTEFDLVKCEGLTPFNRRLPKDFIFSVDKKYGRKTGKKPESFVWGHTLLAGK